MQDEWITAKEALHLIAIQGSGGSAEYQLVDYLQAGLINARARIAKIKPVHGEIEKILNWDIPSLIWKGTHFQLEQPAFSLYSDYYFSRVDGIGYESVDLRGLSFNRVELFNELHLVEPKPSVPVTSSRGGRAPSKKDWEHFAAALAVIAAVDDEGLVTGRSSASVYEKVALVLQARLPKNATFMQEDNVRDAIVLAIEWVAKGVPDPKKDGAD